MLAVQCATLPNCYGMLQNVMLHYGKLQCIMEALQTVIELLWNVAERYRTYGALRDITERYESIVDHYGMLSRCYGAIMLGYETITENIDFAHTAQNALVHCMC